MGMEIPDELANLFYGLTGTKWPDVDEDRLRDLSDMYASVEYILATELPELVLVLRRKVRSTFDGRTTEYFENSLAQFTAGQRDYVGEAAKLAGDIRAYARDAANQVEYAKWMIIGQLVQLAIEIAWAIAMAKFTFGASLAWISVFRFVRSQAIRRILNWLVWNLLSHLFVAQLFGTTMDLLIQRIQMDQGNRDAWDKELTRMAAAGAFVEGLLSAGLSAGADLFLGKQLAKLFGDNLPGPTAPPPVRDIVTDPPPGPSGPPGRGPDPAPDPPPVRDVPDPGPVSGTRGAGPDPLGSPPPVRDGASGPPGPPNDPPGPPGPPPGGGSSGGPSGGSSGGPGRDAAPRPLPPGSVTPEFNRDLVTLFARNSNEFTSPAQRPGTASSGVGHGQRFVDGAGSVFARHFGGEMGEDAARRLGREYAETLLRTWNTPRTSSALGDVLSGAPLPQSTRDHLARDVPDAFGRTVSEFGTRWRDRLAALGIGAGSGALEGYLGEGLTNLVFSPEQRWEASGMSAVAGASSAVVQNLAVSGGLAAIGALNDLRELNNTPAPLPDPDGSGARGPLPDDGGDGNGLPFPPGRGEGGGGRPESPSGNGEEPVLRLRGGGGDDLSFDLGSEYGDGDGYGDGESTYGPSERSESGGEGEAGAGGAGRGRSGSDVAAGPPGREESGGERSTPTGDTGGTRETPRTESAGPGAPYAPSAGTGTEGGRGPGTGSAGSGSGSGSGSGGGSGRSGERGDGTAEPGLSGGGGGRDTAATGGGGEIEGATANLGGEDATRAESSEGTGGDGGNSRRDTEDVEDAKNAEDDRPATGTGPGAPEGEQGNGTGGTGDTALGAEADRETTGTGAPTTTAPSGPGGTSDGSDNGNGNGNGNGQDTTSPGDDRGDAHTGAQEGDREPGPVGSGTDGAGDPPATGGDAGQNRADTGNDTPEGERGNGTDDTTAPGDPAGRSATAPENGPNGTTTHNAPRTGNTDASDHAFTNPPSGEDSGRDITDPGRVRPTSGADTSTPEGEQGDGTGGSGNEASGPGGSAGTPASGDRRGDTDTGVPASGQGNAPAASDIASPQAAPPIGYTPPPEDAAGSRDSSGSARGGRAPAPARVGVEGPRNGTPPRPPSDDGSFHDEARGTELDGTGGFSPLTRGDDVSGPTAEDPVDPSTRPGDGTDLDFFFRSLTPSAESAASDGTSRDIRAEEEPAPGPRSPVEAAADTGIDRADRPGRPTAEHDPLAAAAGGEGGRPPRLESDSGSGDGTRGPAAESPEPPPSAEEADPPAPTPSDERTDTPSVEGGVGGDRGRRAPGTPPVETSRRHTPPGDGRENTGEAPSDPPADTQEGTGNPPQPEDAREDTDGTRDRTTKDTSPPPAKEDKSDTVSPQPTDTREDTDGTRDRTTKDTSPPPAEEDEGGVVPPQPTDTPREPGGTRHRGTEETSPRADPEGETGGTRSTPPVETRPETAGEHPPPPSQEDGARPVPPRRTPALPGADDAITPVVPPPAPPPSAPPLAEATPPLRLNYLIDSRWIESYGVRVDPDAVLDTRPDLPADVRDSFRSRLGADSRNFFSRDGVSLTSADGTTYTLRLRSDDDWRPGGRDRGGAAKAKYKGLHDIQTQESRGESGMVGSARRPVVGFQANLLGGPGLPAPAVGFRGSAFGGSAVQQQSGDSGQTRILTTEMTGSGETYSSTLTAEWTPHRPPPPPATVDGDAPAEGVDLAPVRTEARLDGGVELVLMGGLKRRDDLPAQITFTDPFGPPPSAPPDGTGDTEGTTRGTPGNTSGDGAPPPGDRSRAGTAPARYGGYLANSHPISIEAVTRRTGGTGGTDPGSPAGGRSRWRDALTLRKPRTEETPEPPTGLNSWVATRLGFEAPGEGSNTRRLLHRPRPGSDEPKVAAHPKSGSRAVRRELNRHGVLEVFADDIVMTQLPTMTDEPRTVRVPDSGGGTRLLTIWAPPTSMELVPETPKDFNMKFTDRFAHGASVLANRLKGFFVAVSGGMVTRVPGDMVRVDAPYFETRFQKVWAKGRGRSDNAWDARLFHSTDTAVYRTRRTIAVWLDGDTEPTLFDASGLEAVTADDARRLGGDRPGTRPVQETGDPFLDRTGGPTHLGDALVRDVTHGDGSEARTGEGGGLPQSFFRDFAHRVLLQIDRDYPGLVLPHLAVPGAPEPARSHAGWNHRRNRETAKLNTETVLSKINSSSFRADRDAWLSGQVEIKLVETKPLPFGNELRERRFTVPDHISVWPRARVTGYSEAADPLAKSHTGTTTGSSSGIGRKSDKVTSVTAEGRTGVTVRGVSSGVDSFGAPNNAGGVYFRAANEFRTRTQSEYGVSATAETNVKDKSGSRVLFADMEFSAWMGPDDSLVPRSSRWKAPSRTGLGRELFGGGDGAPAPVRAKVELHTPRNGERFALDAAPGRDPEPPRYLSPAQAKRLFDRGPSAFLSENPPVRLPPLESPPRPETVAEADEGGGAEGTGTGRTPRVQAPAADGAPAADRAADGAPPAERDAQAPAEQETDASVRRNTDGAPPAGRTGDAPARQNTEGTAPADRTADRTPPPGQTTRPPAEQETGTTARGNTDSASPTEQTAPAPARGGGRAPAPEAEPRIDRTDRARRLSQLFSSTQAFNPALTRRGSEVITVTTLTYASLDRNHWAFSRTASSREGAAEIIAAQTSPQTLAASPGLQRDGGSRFRVRLDDGIAPTRTRPTTVTWYVPTHVASVLLRESATLEPNQVKEISYGFGTSRGSVFSVTLVGRGAFSSQPTAATPEQAPRGSGGPILQPGAELRYTPYGHGHGESSSVSFRTRREVKFTGSTFEFVTHGVVLQATEHRQDFDLLFSVPRSPGENDHSAWTAEVRDAQKTMVPSLWVFAEGLVDDALTWEPDGRVTKGAHPPPRGPHRPLVLKPDLAGKGYDSRPVDVPSLVSELEQRLRRGGWRLTGHSREDLVQTVTSHLNRGMTNLSGIEVRVVPTGTRREPSEWTPRVKDRSRVAVLDLGLVLMAPRVEQIGGRMEFVDRNIKVTSTSESDTVFRGYGGGAAMDLLAPIGNREDPATGRQVGAVNAGGTPGYRGQTQLENTSSENRAREETQERVVFTPFAVVTTPTRVDASLRIGDRVYTASVLDEHAEAVYPLPYLEVLGDRDGVGRVDGSGTRYRPAEFGRTGGGSYPDDWAAPQRGPDGRGFQDGTAGLDSVPLAIEGNGREILDAAVVNAARLAGWSRTGGGDLTRAEVDSAARFLDRRITDIERAAGVTARKQEMLLLSLTPEATEDAVTIAEYGDTVVRTRALLDTGGAVIEAVSGESRARDSDQEGVRRSQNTAENQARNVGLGGQATETARPGDRLRENLDADNAALSGARDGVSSGQREGAVAQGPGTKRMFLVRVPARWLVWAENSDPGTSPVGSESDSSVLRWVDEDQARGWGLDTDAPEIGRYSAAEDAFTKADAAYLKARGELFEFVNRADPDSAGDTLREDYERREAKYLELEKDRNRAMREMVDALRDLRGLRSRAAAPVETSSTDAATDAAMDGGETRPAPARETSTTADGGESRPAPAREESTETAVDTPGEESVRGPAGDRPSRPAEENARGHTPVRTRGGEGSGAPGGDRGRTPAGEPQTGPVEEPVPTRTHRGEDGRTPAGETADTAVGDPSSDPADGRTGRAPLTHSAEGDGGRAPTVESVRTPTGEPSPESHRERTPVQGTPIRTQGEESSPATREESADTPLDHPPSGTTDDRTTRDPLTHTGEEDGGHTPAGETPGAPVGDPAPGSLRERAPVPEPPTDREDGSTGLHGLRDEDDFFVTDRDPRAPAPTGFLMTPALPAEQPPGREDDGFDDLYDATPPRSPLAAPAAPDPRAGTSSPLPEQPDATPSGEGAGVRPLPVPLGPPAAETGNASSPPLGESVPAQGQPSGSGPSRGDAQEQAGDGGPVPAPKDPADTASPHRLGTSPSTSAETGDARQSALNTVFFEALTAPLPPPGGPGRPGPGRPGPGRPGPVPAPPGDRGEAGGEGGGPSPGVSDPLGGDRGMDTEEGLSPPTQEDGSGTTPFSPSTATADTSPVPRTSSAPPHPAGADGGRARAAADDRSGNTAADGDSRDDTAGGGRERATTGDGSEGATSGDGSGGAASGDGSGGAASGDDSEDTASGNGSEGGAPYRPGLHGGHSHGREHA